MRAPSVDSHRSSPLACERIEHTGYRNEKVVSFQGGEIGLRAGADAGGGVGVDSRPPPRGRYAQLCPAARGQRGLVRGSSRRSNQPPPLNTADNEVVVVRV